MIARPFGPTGRNVPLFAAGSRAFGDRWRTPREWQLPLAIDDALWAYVASDPDPAYTPMPSTWLNQGRWEDDPEQSLNPATKERRSPLDGI